MNIPHKDSLQFLILHNFSKKEISLIMKTIKQLFPEKVRAKNLIFSITTELSKKMIVEDIIKDMSEDHLYLLQNPPNKNDNSL